jgi:hypothetical protein
MSEKENEEKIVANVHQVVPLLPLSYGPTTGLDCLKMIDTLSIKEMISLSEGKSFEELN